MKKIIIKSISMIIFITSIAAATYAESIFLKDGSILEGWTVKETDKISTIRQQNGNITEILKKDILRIIFDNEYKNKSYIYKLNGDVIEAYIVNEDREAYTYRIDLGSKKETILKKSQVNLISKQKVAGLEKKIVRTETVIFDRFMNFKLGYLSTYAISSTNPGSYNPGFEIGYGYYDKVIEFEMSMSIGFGKTAQIDLLSRFNANFVFGNVFGFGLGVFTSFIKSENGVFSPYMEFSNRGFLAGPVLRISKIFHFSLFMLFSISNELSYKISSNGQSTEFNYPENFNFNMIVSMDFYVWKALSVGLSYTMLGGRFISVGGSSTPAIPVVMINNHQIIVNVGYGFNL